MRFAEAVNALRELVDHRVLLTSYHTDGRREEQMEGELAIGGRAARAEFRAERMDAHQLDLVVWSDQDPFSLMLWRLTESEHAGGQWSDPGGSRVLELRRSNGKSASFELLD